MRAWMYSLSLLLTATAVPALAADVSAPLMPIATKPLAPATAKPAAPAPAATPAPTAAPVVTAPAVTVAPVKVQNGYFLAEECVPEVSPNELNECLCQADIVKAQVSGVSPDAATAINNQLAQLPEQFASESCSGKPAAAPDAKIQVNKVSAGYTTIYQSPTLLSVLINYTTFGAGSAHPMSGSEGYTLDLVTGKTITPWELMTPEQLTKANEFLRAELNKKYGEALFEETRTRMEPYITDAGCEDCTLYYTKDGWNLRFQLYVIAPYSLGEPEITIPVTIIPEPATLLARKK